MSEEIQEYTVQDQQVNMRLDLFVAEKLGITRSQVQKFIDAQRVQRNGKQPKKAGDKVKAGDRITVLPAQSENEPASVEIPDIPIIAETDDYIVIDKPTGVLSHPTMAGEQGTVIHWLKQYYPAVEGVGEDPARPGMMHRLDREASGLMVLAKTQQMFDHLKNQFKARTVSKEYMVLVYGMVELDHDSIDFVIDRKDDGRMAARPHVDLLKVKNVGKGQEGRDALSEFWVEKRFVRHTLLRVKIHTGRTHQIRVHMFAYGNPVVGDTLYCNTKLIKKKDEGLGRLFLHATRLGFEDLAGERVSYEAPLPTQLTNFLQTLR